MPALLSFPNPLASLGSLALGVAGVVFFGGSCILCGIFFYRKRALVRGAHNTYKQTSKEAEIGLFTKQKQKLLTLDDIQFVTHLAEFLRRWYQCTDFTSCHRYMRRSETIKGALEETYYKNIPLDAHVAHITKEMINGLQWDNKT